MRGEIRDECVTPPGTNTYSPASLLWFSSSQRQSSTLQQAGMMSPTFYQTPLPLVFKKEIVKCPPTNFIFMVSFLFKSNYKRKNSICVVIQERAGKVQSKFWVLPLFFFSFLSPWINGIGPHCRGVLWVDFKCRAYKI